MKIINTNLLNKSKIKKKKNLLRSNNLYDVT